VPAMRSVRPAPSLGPRRRWTTPDRARKTVGRTRQYARAEQRLATEVSPTGSGDRCPFTFRRRERHSSGPGAGVRGAH
jgi:hypothetical protein